jgi:phosphoenolpyruvate-protein kinase (PTS system EI component)
MKTKLIILLVSLTLTSMVIACPGGKKHRQNGDNRMEKITQELNLTEQQAAQFKVAAEVRKDKMKQARQNIQEESKADLAQFLSPEQMQILEDKKLLRQNRKGNRQGKGRGNRGQHNS